MTQADKQKQIQALKILGLTEEDVADVLESDKRIDRGEKLFELSDDQKKVEKKYKNCGTRTVKTAYGQTLQKEKKVDEVKTGLIELLTAVITEQPACNSLTVINAEREFNFLWSGKKYKIVLSCPRS